MHKKEFLAKLRKRLLTISDTDLDERISFYSEMIDDRIEDGLSETEAVATIGSIDSIVEQFIKDTPTSKLIKKRLKTKKRLSTTEMTLLICGAPLWFPLILSAFAVVLALYISLWAVIVSLWASSASALASGVGSAVFGIFTSCTGNWCAGLAFFGAGLALSGLSIFMFCGCKRITRAAVLLTKKLVYGIKLCFIGKAARV